MQEKIPRQALGPQGPVTSRLGLGSWNTWDRMPFGDAVDLIGAAVAAGVTLFDVAHYDTGPHAEQGTTDLIFGRAVRAAGVARSDYQLCGKLWLWDYPRSGFADQLATALDRVGVESADAVVVGDYLERPDLVRVVHDVHEQIEAGRFRTWGVNNWPGADLDEAFAVAARDGLAPPSFAQLKYGLVRRTLARQPAYATRFAEGTLGLQASDVLEGGILAGHRHPERKIGADPEGIRDAVRDAADRLADLARDVHASAAQLAIAFCLADPHVTNVLVGVSRRAQLDENLAALALCAQARELSAELDRLWLDR